MRKCVGEVTQVVGEVTQVVREMKQFCWGSDTTIVGEMPKGEMPQIQSDKVMPMVMVVEAAIITEIILHCMRLFNNGGQRGGAVGVGGKDVEEQEKADHRRKVFETLKSSISLKVFKVCWC